MHDITSMFLLLFAGVTTLMMIAAVPLMRGRVRPNLIYGVRTPKTLGDEGVWHQANVYGGRLLFGTGLGQFVSIIAVLRADFVAYNLACGAVILGGILVAVALLMRRLQSL